MWVAKTKTYCTIKYFQIYLYISTRSFSHNLTSGLSKHVNTTWVVYHGDFSAYIWIYSTPENSFFLSLFKQACLTILSPTRSKNKQKSSYTNEKWQHFPCRSDSLTRGARFASSRSAHFLTFWKELIHMMPLEAPANSSSALIRFILYLQQLYTRISLRALPLATARLLQHVFPFTPFPVYPPPPSTTYPPLSPSSYLLP